MSRRFVPDRGDAVWIDMNPSAGREQRGRRAERIAKLPDEVLSGVLARLEALLLS